MTYTSLRAPVLGWRNSIAAIAVTAVCGPFGSAAANAAVQPFADFVQSLSAAPAETFVGQSGAAVESTDALEEMRGHLLSLYSGVSVDQSFAMGDQVFDCVPVKQQPGVRLQGLTKIAKAPTSSPTASPIADLLQGQDNPTATQEAAEQCAAGTIPMRRVTLAETARFKTLKHFFEKGPNGAGQLPSLSQGSHGYAHEYQYVNNFGGFGALNLWNPNVATSSPYNEIFSLSQHWYVGFSPTTQTAEVGWQNYPAKYGTRNSVLFIYWTADKYNKTGCYNLDCAGFVQTNSSVYLGSGFTNYSSAGGSQYEVSVGYYLYQGNWWLAVGSTWVGYYPGSLYNGGQMSRNATLIDFGGETAPGGNYWSAMGSGQFAAKGWQQAAYQRQIVYRDSGNNGYTPSLTVSQPSPSCFTATSPVDSGSWETYFYFGGPGGKLGVC